ncbi:LysM peptidoglycan-binding domain-containing protein [Paenibacillus sp. IB182496]|uniref:LysM peptidoglycan-binding domain-containing protein n=1 Tax=Paenibacillus sabuli TaxID=2772509 RepID=A0A927BRU9_9BACL|nr:LysM peptidoglycan-binding domain-containing protein [Paenibacillus sabuli]MBD2844595.1 LysM peptidoglycan-binding domain-containing protein [Paenibacillus sabuli]
MKIHMVKKGDTLYSIAEKYGVTLEEVIKLNPEIADPNVIDVGMKVKVPSSGEKPSGEGMMHQHKVVQGDTLWKLSKAWGVPLADMIKANPQLKNPNVLLTGEIVNIPKTGSGPNVSIPEPMDNWQMQTPPGKTPTHIITPQAAPVPAMPQPTPAGPETDLFKSYGMPATEVGGMNVMPQPWMPEQSHYGMQQSQSGYGMPQMPMQQMPMQQMPMQQMPMSQMTDMQMPQMPQMPEMPMQQMELQPQAHSAGQMPYGIGPSVLGASEQWPCYPAQGMQAGAADMGAMLPCGEGYGPGHGYTYAAPQELPGQSYGMPGYEQTSGGTQAGGMQMGGMQTGGLQLGGTQLGGMHGGAPSYGGFPMPGAEWGPPPGYPPQSGMQQQGGYGGYQGYASPVPYGMPYGAPYGPYVGGASEKPCNCGCKEKRSEPEKSAAGNSGKSSATTAAAKSVKGDASRSRKSAPPARKASASARKTARVSAKTRRGSQPWIGR